MCNTRTEARISYIHTGKARYNQAGISCTMRERGLGLRSARMANMLPARESQVIVWTRHATRDTGMLEPSDDGLRPVCRGTNRYAPRGAIVTSVST